MGALIGLLLFVTAPFRWLKGLLPVIAALTLVAPAQAAAPGAVISCQFTGQQDFFDPIVEPGVFPSAHRHTFYNVRIDESMDDAELLAEPQNCGVGGNHSGYWIRGLEEDGVDLVPGINASGGGPDYLVYYRCKHNASVCGSIEWFPPETGFVVGNAHASSAAENPLLNSGGDLSGYRCGTGGGQFAPTPPTTCDSGRLVAAAVYGNCLYPDGRVSELTNSNCTMSGGQPILRLQQYFRFWVGTGPVGTITLDGGAPSWQLHADARIAWDPDTSAAFLAECVHDLTPCPNDPILPE